MPWRKKSGFVLVAWKDALQRTGMEPAELLELTNTQQLTRVNEDGRREEVIRVPVELLLDQPEPDE